MDRFGICSTCGGRSIIKNKLKRCYYYIIKIHEEHYNVEGKLHRIDGPAYRMWNIYFLIEEKYYINGKLHRENGPALKYWNDEGNVIFEWYYINGDVHRNNAPAYIEWDSQDNIIKEWYYNKGKFYTFGMQKTKEDNKYFKKGVEIEFDTLLESGKIILRSIKNIKLIKKRYEKILEHSIYWSFPGLGKIMLDINGGI